MAQASKLRNQTDDALQQTLQTLREEIRQLYVDLETKEVTDIRAIRRKKKDVARILTILHEHKLTEEA